MSAKSDRDNRANQLNPNNDTYYSSRGLSGAGGDDDDDAGYAPYLDPAYDQERFALLNGCPPRTETFAFGAVTLEGRTAYRTAAFAAPGSSVGKAAAIVQLEDYLGGFTNLARALLQRVLGSQDLGIFAIFDPTESCLPWHVPFYQENLEATRASISADRLQFTSVRLKPMPRPPDSSFLDALSPGASRRADQAWHELAATKLDILPFIEKLREAVVVDAPSWGTFTVPPSGYLSLDDYRKAWFRLCGDPPR